MNTDATGKGTFSVTEPTGFYTATATDPIGEHLGVLERRRIAGACAATQTTVSSSANPSTVGQQVTFTAVVTATGYQGTPTGTVTFTIDGQAQTPVSLAVVGGVDEAQFITSTLAAGPHTVSAAYSGDSERERQQRVAADADGERAELAGDDDHADVLVEPVDGRASR